MREYTVIDIGSSSIRVANIRDDMKITDMQTKNRKINVCLDPDEEWSTIQSLLSGIVHKGVKAIAVSSLLGWVGIDREGRAVTPCYSYMHQEKDGYKAMESQCKDIDAADICGRQASPEWLAFKLFALMERERKRYDRIDKVISLKGYINYKITGIIAEDYTSAAYTFLFNIREKKWSNEMIQIFGIKRSMLPELKAPSDILGNVHKGLLEVGEERLPVIMGSVDGSTAILGAGGAENGIAVNVMGTTSVFFAVTHLPVEHNAENLIINPHVIPDKWLTGGPMGMFGGTVDWLKHNITDQKLDVNKITEKAASLKAGSDGVVVFPCLAGERTPFWNPEFTGTILGLRPMHTAANILRGIMEAESYCARNIIDKMKCKKLSCKQIRVIGGGAKNNLWMQIKADITGKPVCRVSISEATMYGSMFLCMLGTGTTVAGLPKVREEFKVVPDEKCGREYNILYDRYLEIHNTLEKIYNKIYIV